MSKRKPEYLYHYTNINTLALILKHKKIKCNSLDNVDDLSEGNTDDLGKMGKYVFVSSWTETSEESIPFWKMYTDNLSGVRIRFRCYPFETYDLSNHETRKVNVDLDNEVYIKPKYYFNGKYIAIPKWDILQKVKYTNDSNKLYPKLIDDSGDNTEFKFGILGKHKREEWSFQEEWRYIITFLPISLNELGNLGNKLAQVIYDRLNKKRNLPFESIYLNLAEDAWESMEITLGPCVNEGDRIIVESLVKKYCPSANINNSVLESTIRA